MITNAEAIKFANEVVRPLAERVRNGDVMATEAWRKWTAGKSDLFPNDATALGDRRDAEGVSRLTGADIHTFMNVVASMGQLLDAIGVRDTVRKPCVRDITIGE